MGGQVCQGQLGLRCSVKRRDSQQIKHSFPSLNFQEKRKPSTMQAKIILTRRVFSVLSLCVSGWLRRINSYRACFSYVFRLNRCAFVVRFFFCCCSAFSCDLQNCFVFGKLVASCFSYVVCGVVLFSFASALQGRTRTTKKHVRNLKTYAF